MKRKKWRSPVGPDGRFDPWVSSTTDGQSGWSGCGLST